VVDQRTLDLILEARIGVHYVPTLGHASASLPSQQADRPEQ
jgi:hypothetical protein